MGQHGFNIDLSPDYKELVKSSKLNDSVIKRYINNLGRIWLDCAGYHHKRGDRYIHEPNSIRVTWGEWGPEHITVPGNACGLDIEYSSFGCLYKDGASLTPHNIDFLSQKYLLLIVFTNISETLMLGL